MSKKKRNKKYAGRDAAQGRVVKKFEVDGKFDRRDWLRENRLILTSWGIRVFIVGLVGGLIWLAYSLIF